MVARHNLLGLSKSSANRELEDEAGALHRQAHRELPARTWRR
ncbi:hypothetical protein ACFPRL_23255 [Pseudoclavibacter helvolus]